MLQRDLSGKAEGDRFAQAARRPQAARDPPEIAKSRRGFDLHDAAARTCLTLTKRVALCAALFPKGVCKGIFPNAANRRRSAPLWNPPHLFSCRMGFSEICAWARSEGGAHVAKIICSFDIAAVAVFCACKKLSPHTRKGGHPSESRPAYSGPLQRETAARKRRFSAIAFRRRPSAARKADRGMILSRCQNCTGAHLLTAPSGRCPAGTLALSCKILWKRACLVSKLFGQKTFLVSQLSRRRRICSLLN